MPRRELSRVKTSKHSLRAAAEACIACVTALWLSPGALLMQCVKSSYQSSPCEVSSAPRERFTMSAPVWR